MSVEELVKRIRERARFQEAIRKCDKNAFLEQADISLSKEAADKLEELAAEVENGHRAVLILVEDLAEKNKEIVMLQEKLIEANISLINRANAGGTDG